MILFVKKSGIFTQDVSQLVECIPLHSTEKVLIVPNEPDAFGPVIERNVYRYCAGIKLNQYLQHLYIYEGLRIDSAFLRIALSRFHRHYIHALQDFKRLPAHHLHDFIERLPKQEENALDLWRVEDLEKGEKAIADVSTGDIGMCQDRILE